MNQAPDACKEVSGLQVLWEDDERIFCRGWRADEAGSKRAVLVLLPAEERPAPALLSRLIHEFGLKDDLVAAWAVRPLELWRDHGRTMLVLEDPGGEPLSRLLDGPMDGTASRLCRQFIVPILRAGDIVVIDNLRQPQGRR